MQLSDNMEYTSINYSVKRINKKHRRFFRRLSNACVTILYYFLIIPVFTGCKQISRVPFIRGLEGKVAIQVPDTLEVFKKDRAIVRIAKVNLDEDVFLEQLGDPRGRILIKDTLPISEVMQVDLKKSWEEQKIEITRLNNNEEQAIDTTNYSEWSFGIRPIDYGKVSLVVSISGFVKTKFGTQKIDCPVYEREISIYATGTDKFRVFWHSYQWLSIALVISIFLLLYKIIPNQTIIDYYMPNT